MIFAIFTIHMCEYSSCTESEIELPPYVSRDFVAGQEIPINLTAISTPAGFQYLSLVVFAQAILRHPKRELWPKILAGERTERSMPASDVESSFEQLLLQDNKRPKPVTQGLGCDMKLHDFALLRLFAGTDKEMMKRLKLLCCDRNVDVVDNVLTLVMRASGLDVFLCGGDCFMEFIRDKVRERQSMCVFRFEQPWEVDYLPLGIYLSDDEDETGDVALSQLVWMLVYYTDEQKMNLPCVVLFSQRSIVVVGDGFVHSFDLERSNATAGEVLDQICQNSLVFAAAYDLNLYTPVFRRKFTKTFHSGITANDRKLYIEKMGDKVWNSSDEMTVGTFLKEGVQYPHLFLIDAGFSTKVAYAGEMAVVMAFSPERMRLLCEEFEVTHESLMQAISAYRKFTNWVRYVLEILASDESSVERWIGGVISSLQWNCSHSIEVLIRIGHMFIENEQMQYQLEIAFGPKRYTEYFHKPAREGLMLTSMEFSASKFDTPQLPIKQIFDIIEQPNMSQFMSERLARTNLEVAPGFAQIFQQCLSQAIVF